MSRADGAPVVVMTERVLGDVELALLGLLPDGHLLAGPVSPTAPAAPGASTRSVLAVPVDTAETAVAAGRLLLVDEEQTPIAALAAPEVVSAADGPGGDDANSAGALLAGTLERERHRESGHGRAHGLGPQDLQRPWGGLVVLARPLTDRERLPEPADGDPLLVLVPDVPGSTDGVPTATMVDLALTAARQVGAEVRTAPLRWRDPTSDRALATRLAAALALPPTAVVLRHADDAVDPAAVAWAAARTLLERAADRAPVIGLAPVEEAVLRRWRPPRPERGVAVMFTGLSGSGKSTLARAVRDRIVAETDRTVTLLDGDVVRHLLSSGLGFDRASRVMNVRRIGFVAAEVARHGGMALCAPIAPYASVRDDVRRMVTEVGDFVLVHVSTPLAECERRDLKGLYAAARAGRIPEFTGISDPYDVPDDADLSIDTSTVTTEEGTERVLRFLEDGGWTTGRADVL